MCVIDCDSKMSVQSDYPMNITVKYHEPSLSNPMCRLVRFSPTFCSLKLKKASKIILSVKAKSLQLVTQRYSLFYISH